LYGHCGDVVTLSVKPNDENLFVTGSVDQTSKLWDLRQNAFCQSFVGHTADVNSVFVSVEISAYLSYCLNYFLTKFHPSGLAFSTASEDSTCRLFDIRSDQQVAQYSPPHQGNKGFTSCVLSKSGRYLLAGCDDSNIHMWDVLKTDHAGIKRKKLFFCKSIPSSNIISG
jgi:guanine nucleotide-binding protein subunit beta